MESTHHTIAYVELVAPDLAAARAFYTEAFGWQFNDYGPTYAGIRTADGTGEVGGLNTNGTTPRAREGSCCWSCPRTSTARSPRSRRPVAAW